MTDRRLADVAHTPPHDTRQPVQRRYQRGPDAVPDGGAFDPEHGHDDDGEDDEADERAETLKDVDHTSPDGEGVNHVYRRGTDTE